MASNTGGYDQSSTRRPGTLTDQHGRKWSATIDKKSGYPVGVVQPQGWRGPWMPNQGFFRFKEDAPNVFDIDYAAILNQRLEAHESWAAQFRQAALVRGWNPDDNSKSANITELVGTKPLPVEPIVACMQGNRWMLGLTDKVDQRLEPFVRKRTDRIGRIIAEMDFSDAPEEQAEVEGDSGILDDLNLSDDDLLDLEERVDPSAVGGKLVKPMKKTKVA